MNKVNLEQFQFEYDLTWMSFFQNARGRTYLRYGGREDSGPESHLTKKSLLIAMKQALYLHERKAVQPDNKYEPVPKSVSTPLDLPALKGMFAKRKETCVHCHDVKAAKLKHLRAMGTLDKSMIYTYPSPSALGVGIDSDVQTKVVSVKANSEADRAGVQVGDVIRRIDGQRTLTLADMSRVLELAPDDGTIQLELKRGASVLSKSVAVSDGWKKSVDPSWRSSTGSVGSSSGFWGKALNSSERKRFKLPADALAVKVTFLWGQWARNAGVRHGDVVVKLDGQTKHMTIRQLQAYLHLNRDWGDTVPLTVIRGGKHMPLSMTLPDGPPQ